MAVQKFYNATVTIGGSGGPPYTGGTALPHVHSVTIDRSSDMLDVSEMGVTTKINMAGLNQWTITVEMLQDFVSSSTDDLLNARYGTAAFGIQVKPDSGAVSTSNPEFYGQCVLESYNPIDGTVGDAIMVSAVFQCAGDLTRRTS